MAAISGDPALLGGERTNQFTPGHLWADDQSGLPQPTDRRTDVIKTLCPLSALPGHPAWPAHAPTAS